jgi:hypothetical protein
VTLTAAERAILRDLLLEWSAASEVGWSRPLTLLETRVVLAALDALYDTAEPRTYHRG